MYSEPTFPAPQLYLLRHTLKYPKEISETISCYVLGGLGYIWDLSNITAVSYINFNCT